MTAGGGQPGQQAQLHDYDLIALARRSVPRLASESLDRIRALVEQALAGDEPLDGVLDELARTLGRDA